MVHKNKGSIEKVDKMTLSGYYDSLPTSAPRTLFIKQVAKMAGVSEPTVVNWAKGAKPQRFEHVMILSKVTGIKPEDLWEK